MGRRTTPDVVGVVVIVVLRIHVMAVNRRLKVVRVIFMILPLIRVRWEAVIRRLTHTVLEVHAPARVIVPSKEG